MIKLESAHIEEVRGIRKLDIDFRKGTFAISGPNGSGKSGVIDAIEFGLTGQIGRLTGRGTKGLSVSEHGPHVDKTKFPDAAFVELTGVSSRDRKISDHHAEGLLPEEAQDRPADDDVKAALAEIADHPEITLSRREILRFILVEPTKRSEEIQTILKLDEIGQTRERIEHCPEQASDCAPDRCCAGAVGPGCPAAAPSDPDVTRGRIYWRPLTSGGKCSVCRKSRS